jgi:2',3'-cyclic-nucleotide 2'-phosphodiesterase (5'-nucleotidase family)
VTPATVGPRLAALGLAPVAPDPVAVIARAVRQARRRADVVVLLSTLSRASVETVAQEVPGIDVIVGVDKGVQLLPVEVSGADGKVVLHAAGTRGEYLGFLRLELDAQSEVTGFEGYAIALTDRFARDPEMVELIREHVAQPES